MEIRLATPQEEKNIWGTSFHGTTITASVDELTEILGEENSGASGDGKTLHEWDVKDETNDRYFTIYDWKEYREYPTNEIIHWHIGSALTRTEEETFAEEIRKRIKAIRMRN